MANPLNNQISERIAALHGHYYGSPPSSHLAHVMPGIVVVVLEGTCTPAERVLIQSGDGSGIADIRRRFQHAVEHEFTSVVESVLGQEVRAFIGEVHLEEDVSVGVFLLGRASENMDAFEHEMGRAETSERQQEREERERR